MLIAKCRVFLHPLTPDIFWQTDNSIQLTLSEHSTQANTKPPLILGSGMRFVDITAHRNCVNCPPQTFTLRDPSIFIMYLQVFYYVVITSLDVFQSTLS